MCLRTYYNPSRTAEEGLVGTLVVVLVGLPTFNLITWLSVLSWRLNGGEWLILCIMVAAESMWSYNKL